MPLGLVDREQLFKPFLGALATTGREEGHQLQLQIARLQAPLETIREVAFTLIVSVQKGEVDRALVQLKDEEIVAIVGNLRRRGQTGIQDVLSQQRYGICTGEVRSLRVHCPAFGWNHSGLFLKPEGNLESKTEPAFESSHLVHLTFQIQEL